MKRLLLTPFLLVFALLLYGQEDSMSIKKIPSKKLIAIGSTIGCFSIPQDRPFFPSHFLSPGDGHIQESNLPAVFRSLVIDTRRGQRGQSTHYYINGIRVNQDYTPGESIESIRYSQRDTPAQFEAKPEDLFFQQLLL